MTKKTRVILFLTCLCFFFLIAAISISYSQGYRFDLKTKKIVQTGGIFLKVEPRPAKVFIDEKLERKTDFLFGTVLIKNLLPGKHKIKVEKEGFYSWEKNLEVKEKEVTEAKNIVLIPKEINLTVLTEKDFPLDQIFPATSSENLSIKINGDLYYLDNSGYLFKNNEKLTEMSFKDFKVSPDFKKIVLVRDYEIWVLFLEPQWAMPKREAFEKLFLTRFSKEIGEIFWYTSDYLIFRVGEEIKITEIDNRDRLNIVDLPNFKESFEGKLKIFFNQNNKKLYILSQGNFFVSEKLLP